MLNKLYSYFNSTTKVYLFAGQGTQQKSMLHRFYQIQPAISIIKRIQKILKINIQQICDTDKNNVLNYTPITQPLLVLSHYLHLNYPKKIQIKHNDYMIGHSLGEYSALVASESILLEDCVKLVKKRGQLMMKYTIQQHGMLIVKYKKIACYNSPSCIIIAGKLNSISKFKLLLKNNYKINSLLLPVSTASHCRLLKNMKQQFRQQLNQIKILKPKCYILRNYDCQIYQDQDTIKDGLIKQLDNPVLFYQSIMKIHGTIQFQQIGHKNWILKYAEETINNNK